jgi:hypothetical protein
MKAITLICRVALPLGALLFFGLAGAGAQVVDVRQACTPDAMRLCNEFIPDEGKVKTCMLARRAQLSQECRSAMAGGGAGPRLRGRVRQVRYYRHRRG